MPANNRRSILGSMRNLASFAREHIPQIRGVSALGKIDTLDRMPNGYGALRRNAGADSSSKSGGFGRFSRFSSPNSGNIASSENTTASVGGMTNPSARDSNTIKNWRRV